MKWIDCREAERLIVQDLDEELDHSGNTLLENHLQSCPNCMQMRGEMRSMLDAVRTDVPPLPDKHFWKRYDSTLEARIREKDLERPRRGWRWQVALPSLAAAMIVVAVLLNIDWHTPSIDRIASSSPMEIEELNQIFGPAPDELSASTDNDMTVILSGASDDALVQWFEVEEESGQTFL